MLKTTINKHSCTYTIKNWSCSHCKEKADRIGDYYCFAPELANQNSGFNPNSFEELYKLESDNFWFRSRSQLIIWAFKKFLLNNMNNTSFFEIGCGTGYVLSCISKIFPNLNLYGSDIYSAPLSYAKQRAPKSELFQMDATHIPFREQFDTIGAFDVIEHIKEDELTLSQIYAALRPGGGLMITVPQHPFLWSAVDEMACHKRRYTKKELIKKVTSTGFNIITCTSFVALLLPLMLLSRYRLKKSPPKAINQKQGLRINRLLNASLEFILSMERQMIKASFRFPVGGSLLLIAKKPEKYRDDSF